MVKVLTEELSHIIESEKLFTSSAGDLNSIVLHVRDRSVFEISKYTALKVGVGIVSGCMHAHLLGRKKLKGGPKQANILGGSRRRIALNIRPRLMRMR